MKWPAEQTYGQMMTSKEPARSLLDPVSGPPYPSSHLRNSWLRGNSLRKLAIDRELIQLSLGDSLEWGFRLAVAEPTVTEIKDQSAGQ